jgi:hypothetical protein
MLLVTRKFFNCLAEYVITVCFLFSACFAIESMAYAAEQNSVLLKNDKLYAIPYQ